ncbi:hypothetical protein SAMN05421789_105107 [Kaistella chaponensis]|uniref:Uncharacterized protein n=1 Tax=Kaistella chaponensis TaxID=713588 RepID=A0A1N7LHF4_9FLAO|nr:hypothetical protein SAMN05421789_105107 [Kaistella chaponensis]
MKVIFYIISFLSILLILVTPKSFHDDMTGLLDKIVFIGILINIILGSINKIHLKQYNFYLIALFQFIYCLVTISYYDHNDSYWLRIDSIFSQKEKIFNTALLSSFGFLYLIIALLVITLQIRSFILILYSRQK